MNDHDRWTERLSDYLDGELPSEERAEIRRHVSTCVECTRTLEELNTVVARAAKLGDLPPSRDLWPTVAMRIARAAAPPGRRVSVPVRGERRAARLPVPRLLAAAMIAGLALWAGGSWLSRSLASPSAQPSSDGPVLLPPLEVTPVAMVADTAEITKLEQEFAANRAVLDPYTLQIIENNLALIDQAILESVQALADDPQSDYLNDHLADTLRRKLDLLRDASVVVARNQ